MDERWKWPLLLVALLIFTTATATLAELYLSKRLAMFIATGNGCLIGCVVTSFARRKDENP